MAPERLASLSTAPLKLARWAIGPLDRDTTAGLDLAGLGCCDFFLSVAWGVAVGCDGEAVAVGET